MTIQIPSSGKVVFGGQSKVVMRPSVTPMTAVGGATTDVTVDGVVYRTHTFTSTGILTVTSATDGVATVEYLVVGGGGGGGNGSYRRAGGGGGAGGFLTGRIALQVEDYTITVGTGGASETSGNPSKIASPTVPAILESLGGGTREAIGGSGGGGNANQPGITGSPTSKGLGTSGQGNPGGNGGPEIVSNGGCGGGGGGAGSAGQNGSPTLGSDRSAGGNGQQSSISGYLVSYAGGGGGGGSFTTGGVGGSGVGGAGGGDYLDGLNAVANTGSGGGGGGQTPGSGPVQPGGSGSDGIVIIRYRIT